jgi:hypothetical protein
MTQCIQGCSISYLLKQHLQHCLLVLLFPFDEFGCSCYGHHQGLQLDCWLCYMMEILEETLFNIVVNSDFEFLQLLTL